MNAQILEIFRSIQGEGKYAGVSQVFVRLFECNMHCTWCDTPASIGDGKREYQEMPCDQVLQKLNALDDGCHSVSITGGEPLLQRDFLKEFCPALKASGKTVYVDTNATLPQALEDLIEDVDIIAMDIKLPSSTKQRAFWQEHEDFLNIARRKEVFIKAVISMDTDAAEVIQAAQLVASVDPSIVFILQPNYLDLKRGIIARCVEHQKSCAKILKDVRILPQVHKFMKVR